MTGRKTMTTRQAIEEHYIIVEYKDTGEKWAFPYQPLLWPYDYSWGAHLNDADRQRFGIKIMDEGGI